MLYTSKCGNEVNKIGHHSCPLIVKKIKTRLNMQIGDHVRKKDYSPTLLEGM